MWWLVVWVPHSNRSAIFSFLFLCQLELVLGTLPGVAFTREIDPQTGYDELVVRPESLKLTNTEC